MTEPPRIATWLLDATHLPDREAIAGDLRQEFIDAIVPACGARLAKLWYLGQVMRSMAPLFFRSWQRASLTRASTALVAAAAAAMIPAAALLSLRSFVLSQVPLKASPEVSAAFALILAAVTVVAVFVGITIGVRLLNARS
jgi:hypothetical protein